MFWRFRVYFVVEIFNLSANFVEQNCGQGLTWLIEKKMLIDWEN